VNLVRFSRSIATDYTQIKKALIDTQNQLRTVQTLGTEEHEKVQALEQDNERLRAAERNLLKLKEQMPSIRHHLKLVPKLTE
jgi:5-bromo-4-chloroindolyl phosphate hydrolysis protein